MKKYVIALMFVMLPLTAVAQTISIDSLMAQVAALQAQVIALQHGTTGVAASTGAKCTFTRDLKMGSRGDDVMCLQNTLIAAGYLPVPPTGGDFDSFTKAEVIAWQKVAGIPSTGYFGPKSRAAYNAQVAEGHLSLNTQPVPARTESMPQPVSSPTPDINGKIQYIVKIVCPVKDGTMSGTGTIIYGTSTTDSKVITNKHVVDGAIAPCGVYRTLAYENQPVLYFKSSTAFIFSKNYDLAIITPDVKTISYTNINVQFNESSDIFNKNILVLGYPASAGSNITLTKGIISGSEMVNGVALYKTDAKIDSGNSGGAVFDETGKFLGVPTLASHGNFSSYGYIIPVSIVKNFLNLVEQEGYQKQNWQHPELSIYGVNPSNTVPDVSSGVPQNQAPQQQREDSALKIARCQAEAKVNSDTAKALLYKDAEDGFAKNIADAEEGIKKIQIAMANKASEITPEEFRQYSPAVQDAIRSGNVEALRPQLNYYISMKQKNLDLLQNYKNQIDTAFNQLANSEYLKCLNK